MKCKLWWKQTIAAFLTFSMTLSTLPMGALAVEDEEPPAQSQASVQTSQAAVTAFESELAFQPAEDAELLSAAAQDVEYAPLSGQVVDGEGNGIADVSVVIFDFELGEVLDHVTTTTSGNWSFPEAQVGLTYRVGYYHPNYSFDPYHESVETKSGGITLTLVTGEKHTVFDGVTTPADSFTYTVQDTYYATITSYTGSDTVVVVPETIDGYIVRRIANDVFKNQKNITAISLPDTIIRIGNSAFENCCTHLPEPAQHRYPSGQLCL